MQQDTEQQDSLLVESLQHLALAATTDKQRIAQLVAANAKLTENIAKLTDNLAQAMQTVAALTGLKVVSTLTPLNELPGASAPKFKFTNQQI